MTHSDIQALYRFRDLLPDGKAQAVLRDALKGYLARLDEGARRNNELCRKLQYGDAP
jgi:hypothetical protein